MEGVVKPVYWTSRALKDLEKVTRFNATLYGFSKAIVIATGLRERTEVLENSNFKEIGAVDEDFVHLKYEYRKLIHHHCKITYREGKSKIYINRVFDTRQNPTKNK
ncbi:type II toxin-antitoxin system RelE/ParE family toxin [Flavobacterium daejeonense]|uniref:type II toxin-antitoxin system RelE/ParE family toxin n=1 Tax=Flavobacterium daejeonense TaxID=350893 RepID=UPI00047A7077|nr:type II toxin-antitoxin system RelE/ParE family toxin [Flavobacterium daejeonense]